MNTNADTKYWSQFLSLPLWQLVLLSLDIEPRRLIESRVYNGEYSGWPNIEKKYAYDERLNIALNHIQCGSLKSDRSYPLYPNFSRRQVQISKFVSWSQSSIINWEIPKWLKGLELKAEQPEAPKKLNMKGENFSDKLLAIVLTMDPLDYSQPYVAAKIIEAQGKTLGITLNEKTIAEKIKKATLHIKQIETTS